jgi:hypothetical protein
MPEYVWLVAIRRIDFLFGRGLARIILLERSMREVDDCIERRRRTLSASTALGSIFTFTDAIAAEYHRNNIMTRKYTKKLLELVNDHCINRDMLIQNLLGYMSETEVRDFAESEFPEFFDDEERSLYE